MKNCEVVLDAKTVVDSCTETTDMTLTIVLPDRIVELLQRNAVFCFDLAEFNEGGGQIKLEVNVVHSVSSN